MGKVTSRTSHEKNLADHITNTDHSRTKIAEGGKVIADKRGSTEKQAEERASKEYQEKKR
jgi:hypothetical protein